MEEQKEHLQALSDIRSMMERSSRFISLSGLSGVFAGVFALIGAAIGYSRICAYMKTEYEYDVYRQRSGGVLFHENYGLVAELFIIAMLVLAASLIVGILLTIRTSKKRGIRIWDTTAKRLLINLLIPLATGGLFCLLLVWHGEIWLVAPSTLIFYGLALLNASKYTLDDIRYLGICEIMLGLIAAYSMSYGLYFWAFGFGVLHIVYGGVMYFKYERAQEPVQKEIL